MKNPHIILGMNKDALARGNPRNMKQQKKKKNNKVAKER